jgi:hypothetical protein
MIEASPTALELAVLRDLCRQLPSDDRAALEEQINGISVLSRKNTGGGFYTHFAVGKKMTQPIKVDVKKYHVSATINGVDDALGFLLWLKDGYVDFLEGFTLALDSTEDLDLAALRFELISPTGTSN